jgi:hypothetical protein
LCHSGVIWIGFFGLLVDPLLDVFAHIMRRVNLIRRDWLRGSDVSVKNANARSAIDLRRMRAGIRPLRRPRCAKANASSKRGRGNEERT